MNGRIIQLNSYLHINRLEDSGAMVAKHEYLQYNRMEINRAVKVLTLPYTVIGGVCTFLYEMKGAMI